MSDESLRTIIGRVKAASDAKRKQLEADGVAPPPDAPPSPPACVYCSDRGWYTLPVGVEDPRFGKSYSCACQTERLASDRLRRLRIYSNLGSLARFTFDTLDDSRPAPANAQSFSASCIAAQNYSRDPSGWLVFHGPPGSGKTHLAAAIANRLIENGRIVLFVTASDLLDELRAGYSPDNDMSFREIYQRVSEAEILFIDALGISSVTDWAHEKLLQLINHRFNTTMPTVFTLSSDLTSLDPHLQVRLQDPTISRVFATGIKSTSNSSVLPPQSLMSRMTFHTFQPRGTAETRESLMTAKKSAMRFAEDPHGWLLLCGPTGVGKTHLAVAATTTLMATYEVYYSRVQALMQRLQSAFSTSTRSDFTSLFSAAVDAQVLILDDLGKETHSPWVDATLYELLAQRHDLEIPTLITTSYDMRNEVGPIASRLRDNRLSKMLLMTAPDYRIQPPSA